MDWNMLLPIHHKDSRFELGSFTKYWRYRRKAVTQGTSEHLVSNIKWF